MRSSRSALSWRPIVIPHLLSYLSYAILLALSDDTEEDGYVSDDEEDVEEDEDDTAPEDPLSFDADEVCASAAAVPVLEAMRRHLIRSSLPSQGGNSAR